MSVELDPRARGILAASRELDAPDPDVAERSWTSLERRIAAGEEPASPGAPARRRNWASWRGFGIGVLVGVGLAASVVLVIGGGPSTFFRTAGSAAGAARYDATHGGEGGVADVREPTVGSAVPAMPPAEPVFEPAVAAPAQPGESTPAPAWPEAVPHGSAGGGHPRAVRSRSSAGENLAAEVALVRQAERDLAEHRPGAALAEVRDHARRFPHGQLARERRLLELEALCLLGRMDEARRIAAAAASGAPSELERRRLRRACGQDLVAEAVTKTAATGHGP